MRARILATAVAVVFAIGAFCGAGPAAAGLFNPFGFLFLLIAFLMWRYWFIIVGDFSPPSLDGMTRRFVDRGGADKP